MGNLTQSFGQPGFANGLRGIDLIPLVHLQALLAQSIASSCPFEFRFSGSTWDHRVHGHWARTAINDLHGVFAWRQAERFKDDLLRLADACG